MVVAALHAEPKVEANVIYGMYSGLALLMDVWHPERPNGYGVVHISGSGWHAPMEMNAEPLSHNAQTRMYGKRLADAGYTVFSISHRAAPRFRYPAAVEDAQRAVRFVRHNAKRWGIRADRIGAVGGSSGGHLVLMLGTLDGKGIEGDPDAVNRESAKAQCVVARAAPADLSRMAIGAVVSFIGRPAPAKQYGEASPISHVSSDDPPILLMHGDKDATVPFEQSEIMEKALKAAGVAAKLLRVPGGGHGPTFANPPDPPDYMGEMVQWLDQHLKIK